MNQLLFKLDVFEGPLDLMLHLISKNKLDINNIEINLLLEQYIDHIEHMKLVDMDVTADFLIMAARLVYIKTLSLLPKQEEAQELKKELEGQLLEYQICKYMSQILQENYKGYSIFVRKIMHIDTNNNYRFYHSSDELFDIYKKLGIKKKEKLPPKQSDFSGIVSRKIVPVEVRIVFILKKLYEKGKVEYSEFFSSEERSDLVATFLAMLELIKSKRIIVSEDRKFILFEDKAGE